MTELDMRARESSAPYRIVTADCSDPREIDDGVFVQPLPAASETYRVGVCVADTSSLYSNGDIVRGVLERTAARYWQLPSGERGYDPMIDPSAIRKLELKRGEVRSALVVSFVVGEHQPPSQTDIIFHEVQVERNMSYKNFGRAVRYSERYKHYGRAAAMIAHHLKFNPDGDADAARGIELPRDTESMYHRLIHVPSKEAWMRGARMNEAFMIAANYLVGTTLAEEGRPAIYRVHDSKDESYLEFMPPNVARFSARPGRHEGLDLDIYCRVTSPLRRLEDFMMNYQLKQRALGRIAVPKDYKDLAAAIQRLNQEVVSEIGRGPLRLTTQDTLGSMSFPKTETEDAVILPLPLSRTAAAS